MRDLPEILSQHPGHLFVNEISTEPVTTIVSLNDHHRVEGKALLLDHAETEIEIENEIEISHLPLALHLLTATVKVTFLELHQQVPQVVATRPLPVRPQQVPVPLRRQASHEAAIPF